MRMGCRRRHPRGVALVFALFTIAILITMSATVVALAIRHGRAGTSTNDAEAALHAANWGLEATINYMGVGGPAPTGNWQARASGYTDSYHLAPTSGKQALGGLVMVRVTVRDDLRPAGASAGDTRLVQFFDATNTNEYEMLINGPNQAKVSVLVTEYRISGQPSHYQVTSTAQVIDSSDAILATRVVEARIREQSALDFMHFIQNAKAWDVSGVNPGSANARDIVGIPEGYAEKGKMRVDGGGAVPGTAGTLKFYGKGAGTSRWNFSGEVTMSGNKGSLQFTDPTADKDLNTIFNGGLKPGEKSLGLPQQNGYMDYARGKATTCSYSIGGNGATAYTDTNTNPAYVPDVMKSPGNDARPSFAKVVVTLDGANVKIEKVNPARPGRTQTLYSGAADGIANGIVAVQGGNVEVQSAKDGAGNPKPFLGNLTIVSDDNAGRAQPLDGSKSYPQNNGTIYADAARTFFDANPHLPPPYTERQIFGATGSSTRYVWPPPPARVEREGNTMITSDIQYGNTGTKPPTLGIVSQNFVLLNDRQGDNNLRVDAVLMSMDHSVQFDWDNMAQNSNHSNLIAQGVTRTFQLNGAVIGGFLDVEGDAARRGYFNQSFTHDENLRFQLPPSFPKWDRTSSQAPSGVAYNWVLMNYVDKGTVNKFTNF